MVAFVVGCVGAAAAWGLFKLGRARYEAARREHAVAIAAVLDRKGG